MLRYICARHCGDDDFSAIARSRLPVCSRRRPDSLRRARRSVCITISNRILSFFVSRRRPDSLRLAWRSIFITISIRILSFIVSRRRPDALRLAWRSIFITILITTLSFFQWQCSSCNCLPAYLVGVHCICKFLSGKICLPILSAHCMSVVRKTGAAATAALVETTSLSIMVLL